MDAIGESRFWRPLWRQYAFAPSIALCRVPELELASGLALQGATLDHCCGDGFFAALAWPQSRFSAGCDKSELAIDAARRRIRHEKLDICDVSARLPYPDATFDLVFNNSGIEHVEDLAGALREVARVTRPGGLFCFSVLNRRFFENWPLDGESMRLYREWQPFFHALGLEEWKARLVEAGFTLEDVGGYLPEEASRLLARLDFEFSGFYLRGRPSPLVAAFRSRIPLARLRWRRRLGRLRWRTGRDAGAGYFFRWRRG